MIAEEQPTIFDSDLMNWMDRLIEGENSIINAPKEKLDQMYSFGYSLYQKREYQQAGHCFRLLIVGNPKEKKFWKGLAATLQMQKCYEDALNCYLSIQILDQHIIDPYLYIHVADCYFALNKDKEGTHALNVAFTEAKKKKIKEVIQHVTLIREIRSTKKQ